MLRSAPLRAFLVAAALSAAAGGLVAAEVRITTPPPDPASLRLRTFAYPFPVEMLRITSQQQELELAFMDVKPAGPPRGVVLLLHGKNFTGAYWAETAAALRNEGYRVLVPDQIGFGKSSKPASYQFTFHQLAATTSELLRQRQITQAHVIGHSMGGMLAVRFARMFPDLTASLTLVNPIGLEDWSARGVPYRGPDALFLQELQQNAETIRAYQQKNYYAGDWKPAYQPWVDLLASFTESPDYARIAWIQALTSEMIYTQPVVYEFDQVRVPVLLLVGQRDRTAPGRELAPEPARAELGNYPELGRRAAAAFPDAQLVELDELGHVPHVENFTRFFAPLREFLDARTAPAAPEK